MILRSIAIILCLVTAGCLAPPNHTPGASCRAWILNADGTSPNVLPEEQRRVETPGPASWSFMAAGDCPEVAWRLERADGHVTWFEGPDVTFTLDVVAIYALNIVSPILDDFGEPAMVVHDFFWLELLETEIEAYFPAAMDNVEIRVPACCPTRAMINAWTPGGQGPLSHPGPWVQLVDGDGKIIGQDSKTLSFNDNMEPPGQEWWQGYKMGNLTFSINREDVRSPFFNVAVAATYQVMGSFSQLNLLDEGMVIPGPDKGSQS